MFKLAFAVCAVAALATGVICLWSCGQTYQALGLALAPLAFAVASK